MFLNDRKVKQAFNVIKEELNEHLESINENTDELQHITSYCHELETRLNKVEDHLVKMEMMIEEMLHPKLTRQEEAIFRMLYESERNPLSYTDLSVPLKIPELAVRKSLASMMKKGVEIDISIIDGKPFFRLAKSFRDAQAKDNILKLQAVSR